MSTPSYRYSAIIFTVRNLVRCLVNYIYALFARVFFFPLRVCGMTAFAAIPILLGALSDALQIEKVEFPSTHNSYLASFVVKVLDSTYPNTAGSNATGFWIFSPVILNQRYIPVSPKHHSLFRNITNLHCLLCFHSSSYAKARQLFCSNQYSGIIENCTEEIETDGPHKPEAILMRATFYLLMGQALEARPDLDRLIGMEESHQKVGLRNAHTHTHKMFDCPLMTLLHWIHWL